METRSPPPRLYRLITHKFKVTRGTPLHPVKTRGTDLTAVCPSHHNHTRENLPGAPPHTLPIRYLPKVYKYERYITLYCTAPLTHAVDLKPRGCSKLKRGTTGVPLCTLYMSLARLAGVVPLLLLLLLLLYRCYCCTARMDLKFRGSVGRNRNRPSLCSGWQPTYAHTHSTVCRCQNVRP